MCCLKRYKNNFPYNLRSTSRPWPLLLLNTERHILNLLINEIHLNHHHRPVHLPAAILCLSHTLFFALSHRLMLYSPDPSTLNQPHFPKLSLDITRSNTCSNHYLRCGRNCQWAENGRKHGHCRFGSIFDDHGKCGWAGWKVLGGVEGVLRGDLRSRDCGGGARGRVSRGARRGESWFWI